MPTRFTRPHRRDGHARGSGSSVVKMNALRSLRRAALLFGLGLATSVASEAQVFVPATASLTNTRNGCAVWGDYNGDDALDALLTGRASSGDFADIFNNASSFTGISAGLTGVGTSGGRNHSAWGDFDGDGDLDLAVMGKSGTLPLPAIKVYRNNSGSFSAVTVPALGLYGGTLGALAWGDYDNDGDQDLFLTGSTATLVYRNDGAGGGSNWNFSQVLSSITPVSKSDGAWGDYDNDGDLDLVVAGEQGANAPLTRLYRNDHGTFVNSGASLINVTEASVAWGDYDNDGDLDLAITGIDAIGHRQFRLYQNNGGGSFSPISSTGVTAVYKGSLAWGDYNNDGNLDLLVSGDNGSSPVTVVYTGNGLGSFTALSNSGLTGVVDGQASWGDYNNDGKLDILLEGQDASGNPFSKIYRNTASVSANTAPSAPSSVTTATTWKSVTISWSGASDAETPSSGLSYNVYLRDVTAGKTIMAPMSNTSNGFRLVPALGNANENTSWKIGGLTPGHTYSACVQAVDGAWAGSSFTCTSNFTLPTTGPDVMIADCSGDVGAEPNTACSGCYWNSPSIYVRNIQDGLTNTTDQSPLSAQSNYVYIVLQNLNGTDLTSGTVDLYFSHPSTSFGWQYQWVNYYQLSTSNTLIPYGDYVGSVTIGPTGQIPSVPAHSTRTVWVEWQNVPDPSDYTGTAPDHFCLLARLNADADPISHAEGLDVVQNTMNNNNIAWRNVYIIDTDGPHKVKAPVKFGDASTQGRTFHFNFTAANQADALTDHCNVVLDLGQALFNKWVNGGSQGSNVELVEGEPTQIRIKSGDASISNLQFDAGDLYDVEVSFDPTNYSGVEGNSYLWHMSQTVDGDDLPCGGQSYQVKMPSGSAGKRTTPETGADAARQYDLAAHPNPTGGSTIISYTLPADASVTVAIYDAKGSLVRTLVGGVDQTRGSHQVEWNGTGLSGVQVPAGTYFYRLQAGTRSLEQQIKIVR